MKYHLNLDFTLIINLFFSFRFEQLTLYTLGLW